MPATAARAARLPGPGTDVFITGRRLVVKAAGISRSRCICSDDIIHQLSSPSPAT